ncbi:butyrophilin subfamily 1 member A1-like isoform X2 [Lynx canadensis]|uniref:butyrophilin subfamily 1 member A1-like isoform X2 n=1 Tax=Lynx canadensis TaxID=61383 RepID=UPI0011B0DBD4|nr:butyrophilin subfamily 1 member A1-like isoform X2 [Lynx canadensis]
MQPFCVSIRTLLLSVLLSRPGEGQFQVIGPRAPVVAFVGEEVVVSCHLNPSIDAQNMEVRWYRNDPSGLVHYYGTSQDHMDQQMPEYQGRTKFLKENITKGLVALRIHHIRPSDEGEYVCFFESSTFYNKAQFKVLVTVSGTAPHIHIEPGNRMDMKMTCTSTGWYPEPEVQWRELQGPHLAPAFETKKIEENGLFHVESSITVDKNSRADVSCVIRNLILSVEKEVHVSVADTLFPEDCPWAVGFAVFLSLLAFGATISVLFVCTRKAKGSLKKKHGKLRKEYELLREQKGKLHEELERIKFLGEEGLKYARRYAENVTLDPDTANPYLQITDDNKSVKGGDTFQELPKRRQRFDNLVCVLGQQIFSKGKHYWEVSVKNKIKWTLGICKDSVCRRGEIMVSSETGFWTIGLNRNNDYQALLNPQKTLHLEESPETIGIFLDYEAGRVSFYNVTNLSHIYTYRNCFTGSLRPYFYPGPLYNGQNEHPLTILPLGHIRKAIGRRRSM